MVQAVSAVGATPDLLVEPLLGIVRADLAPDLLGKRGERQQIRTGGFEVVGDLWELVSQRVDDPIVLRGKRFLVGLIEHRMQQGLTHGHDAFG